MKARFVALLSALSFVGIMISGCGAIAVNPDTLADAAVTAEDFDVAAAFALSAPLTESERLAISADVRALLTLRAQLESPARVTQLLADPEAFRTFLLEVSYRYLSGRKAFIAYLTRTQGIAPQALVKYDADARATPGSRSARRLMPPAPASVPSSASAPRSCSAGCSAPSPPTGACASRRSESAANTITMSTFTLPLVLEATDAGKAPWRVHLPFKYVLEPFAASAWEVRIKRGASTDLASVPLLRPDRRTRKPAAVHDELYQRPVLYTRLGLPLTHPRYTRGVTREEADGIFYEAMVVAGVPHWKRAIYFSAVRTFGGRRWRELRARDELAAKVEQMRREQGL